MARPLRITLGEPKDGSSIPMIARRPFFTLVAAAFALALAPPVLAASAEDFVKAKQAELMKLVKAGKSDAEVDKVFDQVLDYARQFVAPNKPSKAVGLIKRAIQTGLQGSQWEGLAYERELLAQAFASGDAVEGLSAYKEKRVARFEGK